MHASPSEHSNDDNNDGDGDGDDDADEEEEVAVQHGVEEDEDSDSEQQDRRASHAQASTRGGDEAMPGGTPAAGTLPLIIYLTSHHYHCFSHVLVRQHLHSVSAHADLQTSSGYKIDSSVSC